MLVLVVVLMIIYFQVRKRPLNKKELAKTEEDIVETRFNSLVVHETKLKVCGNANDLSCISS